MNLCSSDMDIWSLLPEFLEFLSGLFHHPVCQRYACLIKDFTLLEDLGDIMVGLSTNSWNILEDNKGLRPMLLGVILCECFILRVLTCIISCDNSALNTSNKLSSSCRIRFSLE